MPFPDRPREPKHDDALNVMRNVVLPFLAITAIYVVIRQFLL